MVDGIQELLGGECLVTCINLSIDHVLLWQVEECRRWKQTVLSTQMAGN